MFDKLLRFFKLGLYTKNQIRQFVVKGVITAAQYEIITGGKYD